MNFLTKPQKTYIKRSLFEIQIKLKLWNLKNPINFNVHHRLLLYKVNSFELYKKQQKKIKNTKTTNQH